MLSFVVSRIGFYGWNASEALFHCSDTPILFFMKTLNQIKAPIDPELDEFQKRFRESMKTEGFLMDTVLQYIIKSKGKQMRPMFVLLAAKVCGGISEHTYNAATLVELLHTATLVHDDVVDDSMERRGFWSINALWKNKIAVLVGDYLLSRGLLLALENNETHILRITSRAVKEMAEGELLQIEKARRLDIKEEIYYDIIKKKTATLIAAACSAGAASATQDKELIEQMRLLGEKMGIAFQIRDDLFDLGDGDAGKPQMNDLKERKMTLPLIYALNNSDAAKRKYIIGIVKNRNTEPKAIKEVADFIQQAGGMDYARKEMYRWRDEALEQLRSMFPHSPARDTFEELVVFVTERKQ